MHRTDASEAPIARGLKRWAWVPISVLLMAIAVLWAVDLPGDFNAPRLLLSLNFVFSTLISLFIASLIARSFLVRGTPGLLLLGCGVLVWGVAGVAGAAAGLMGGAGQQTVNINVTIFNTCALLSALCHLAGALFSLRPMRPIRAAGLLLATSYVLVFGAAGLVTIAAYSHWLPTFFVQGRGGTPLRQAVLGLAILMFTLAAVLLWAGHRRSASSFSSWYAPALTLIATGLFGLMAQSSFDGAMSWLGRSGQYLGGIYMLIAAIESVRETHALGIPLGIALAEAKQQHERDEEALRQSDFRLRLALEAMSLAIHDYQPETGELFWDERCRVIFGLGPDDPVDINTFWRGVHPEDVAGMEAALVAAFDPSGSGWFGMDYRVRPFDGLSERWVHATGQAIFSGEGAQRRAVRFIGTVQDITERKRTEDALRESERRLRLLINAVPATSLLLKPDGRILAVNESAAEALRSTTAEMIGRNAYDFLPPELAASRWEQVENALRTGRPVQFEDVRHGRHIENSIHPLLDSHGEVDLLAVFGQDVTERKRAEAVLRRQNATLEGINRILGAALTCQTEEELGIACLEVAEQLTQSQFGFIGEINERGLQDIAISNPGWDACQIIDPSGHRRPEGSFKIRGLYGRVLASGQSLFTNEPAHHPDRIGLPAGHPPLESFLGVPLTHEGRVIGIAAVGNREGGFSRTEQEILETLAPVIVAAFMRKRVERALCEANERLTYHMDSSPLAVIEWGADMRLIRWSGEAERIFGWKAEEVLGKRMEDFRWIYEEDGPEVNEVSAELRDGRNPQRFSANRNYRKDGSVVECEWYNSSLLDESGRMRSILSLVLDVTARNQAQAALQAANAQLAEADRRKDEFLAMLAHELRNPLAPVRNAVGVMRLAGEREELRKRQQDIIERQVAHMARLLDDLLDVSRVTRGKIELRPQALDLTNVLAHAVEVVTPLVQERRHTLHFEPSLGDLRVHADMDRLAQAVGNLLINAAKYTDEGGEIWLEAARKGQQAVIRVRDTGVGIAPDLLPHVFDLFIQADRSIDRSQGGLGIGLTMVQKLVQMHGGTVEARSEGLGKGSEFMIRLPALPEAGADSPLPPAHPEVAFGANAMRRVLVVDDIADAAVSLGELLEIWGHDVRTAHSGPAALKLLCDFMPDVVLMDIGMPGMNGCEVARRMRQLECGRNLRLVALTGYGQTQDREETRASGFDDHLVKPVDLEALRTLLATASEPIQNKKGGPAKTIGGPSPAF